MIVKEFFVLWRNDSEKSLVPKQYIGRGGPPARKFGFGSGYAASDPVGAP